MGAQYDSRERQPHPKCLEGTRVDLLKYIYRSLDEEENNQLIWLHGTAGVGKSAVAFTVAERMKGLKVTEETNVEKRLAGTFFFSRKHTKRCTTGYFFATLAYQLANNFPSIRKDVNRVIRDNPALLDPDTSLCDQMEALFLQPLRKLQLRLRGCPPLTFVIDALDECTSESELIDLILLLARALREPDLPVTHVLLTSRSELHICKAFHNDEVQPLLCEIPVKTSGEGVAAIISLDGADVDTDIYKFLQYSFTELESRHPDFPKPTRDELAQLASRAGRRFIVASTMVKFIIDDEDKDPRDRLQLMLKLTSELLPGTEVYKLYDQILSTCADPTRAYLHLSIVAALADPLPISQISSLLGPGLGRDVQTTLIQLRSVMDVPTDTILPVNIYHSSIRDYVSDPSNCSLPQVYEHDMPSPHTLLADSSLRLMMKKIPESTALLDGLLELQKHSQAMQPQDPQILKDSLTFLVQPLEPVSVLISMLWLRGDHSSDLRFWVETLDGCAWLQTRGGDDWLHTQRGRDWLQTQGGRAWLRATHGQDWLQTLRRRYWLRIQGDQAQEGHDSLQTHEGRAWLQTHEGRAWLQTEVGQWWLRLPAGRTWLRTPGGRDWLRTPGGDDWLRRHDGILLHTQDAQQWPPTPICPERFYIQGEVSNTCREDLLLKTRGPDWLPITHRDWLQTMQRKFWLHTQEGHNWLQTQGGQDWLQNRGGQDWLQTQVAREWLQTQKGNLWLQTQGGLAWLQTQGGQAWLQTRGGQAWLHTVEGQELLWGDWSQNPDRGVLFQTLIRDLQDWFWRQGIREWVETQDGRDWLQMQKGQEWLQMQEGKEWLQMQGGKEWLQMQGGRQWLQTHGGKEWLQTHEGRGWFQMRGGKEWLQTQDGQEWLQTHGGKEWLQTQGGKEWLQTHDGRQWLQTQGGRQWLQTHEGRGWLQTQGGKEWLQTHDGRQWLQTHGGRQWLQTQGGRDWLQTQGGKEWLQTQRGRHWLQTHEGRHWLQTQDGQEWLQTQGGQVWLQNWLQMQGGQEWLQTQGGREWLWTEGQEWLQMHEGQEWLQTQGGREWLQTQIGRKWLQTQIGQHWLRTHGGREWLQMQEGREWLQMQGGQDWLQTPHGRDWLQTPRGRDWLQTPHGKAWQSTPAASVWVIMEEFTSTLEAISKYPIVEEFLSLPAFQVVQRFKSLPDFLMFPTFVALMHQVHLSSTLPADLPNRKIIHDMNTFTTFANEALQQSRSSSQALKYACQNWAVHLSRAPNPRDGMLNHIFKTFWNRYLLSWLERQWCLKGLRSCLDILSEGQTSAKVCVF